MAGVTVPLTALLTLKPKHNNAQLKEQLLAKRD
jgi:hypothetical protein